MAILKQGIVGETLIDHPMAIIENLLRLRIGDEGRLLYLQRAITKGKTIHETDKKYLKKMVEKLKITDGFNSNQVLSFDDNHNTSPEPQKNMEKIFNATNSEKNKTKENNYLQSDFESEINQIQNSISEIKKRDSKIRDNLELLIVNREILTKHTINQAPTFVNLTKSSTADMFDLLNDTSNTKKFSLLGMKKHDALTYASAGLFTLWYGSYQNIVNLDNLQTIPLILSVGSAVSAAILYKRNKNSKQQFLRPIKS